MIGVTFARGNTFFHVGSLLLVKFFARRHLLHDITFAWRHFCKASFLHGIILLRKKLCTAKTLNNRSIFIGDSLLHAFNFYFLK